MDPEQQGGGGGLLSGRILGIPTLLWVAGAALVAFWLFSRNSQGSGAGSSAGGSDTLTTGNTTVSSGAVRVTVNAGNNADDDNDQPKPPGRGGHKTVTVPDVVGKPGEAAADAIQGAGLKFRQIPARTPKGKPTVVTAENPRGGGKVRKGTTVTTHVRTKR